MEVNYKELKAALSFLKFMDKSTKDFFVFYNEQYDAMVLLPLKEDKAVVDKAYFAAITYILTGKGVIQDRNILAKIIENHRLIYQKVLA